MKSFLCSLGLLLVVGYCVHSSPLEAASETRERRGGHWPAHCGAVCAIECPYGNVLDSTACPTCDCHEAPGCPQIQCPIPCPNSYKIVNGCSSCECQ
ncbi:BPTI/Kunitz domain-containing protein 4-like [Littorina saxatilis]|uniref:Antistasin-like domain-containing protein n=1 Tax=Littorina saxatilis TaxID=31220 RepID=A0AAN9FXT9_9CAEN